MKNNWIAGMLMIALLPISAAAQNSYMAKPGNGSLFGGDKGKKVTVSQTTKQEKTSYNSDYSTRTGNWGVGLHAGFAQNNPKGMKDAEDEIIASDPGAYHDLSESSIVFGLEALYETSLNDEANKIGFKAGWDWYGRNKLDVATYGFRAEATETTYAFPLTVYYKRDNGVKNLSWMAGVGITIMHSEVESKMTGEPDETDSKTKVFPHITLGAEYRFTELFALGLDVRYNIAAKIKKDGDVLSDRSGLGAALAARFYF